MIHSVNDLISTASEARRNMWLDSLKKAEELRLAIDNELYKQALKGQNQCIIELYKYKDSDPCGYIIERLVGLLKKEGFNVEHIEVSELLIVKW